MWCMPLCCCLPAQSKPCASTPSMSSYRMVSIDQRRTHRELITCAKVLSCCLVRLRAHKIQGGCWLGKRRAGQQTTNTSLLKHEPIHTAYVRTPCAFLYMLLQHSVLKWCLTEHDQLGWTGVMRQGAVKLLMSTAASVNQHVKHNFRFHFLTCSNTLFADKSKRSAENWPAGQLESQLVSSMPLS